MNERYRYRCVYIGSTNVKYGTVFAVSDNIYNNEKEKIEIYG